MLLLTDGRVFCHEMETPRWRFLTPDALGDYLQGQWTRAADLPALTNGPDSPGPNAPLFFASAVLRNGNVFVAGGEYNNGGDQHVDLLAAQVYDPVHDRWTVLPTPDDWTNIGDACCCVLADGRVLLGAIEGTAAALYDPEQNLWVPAGPKNSPSNEETWTLLPDGSVLTADCDDHPAAERYIPSTNTWVSAGRTPVDLVEDASKEIGPALLLTDGRVLAIGANGNTALYDPSGTWVAGPAFPIVDKQTIGAKDAPAVLLPNGRVLCAVGPVNGEKDFYGKPTYFFEFNPSTNTLTRVAEPPNSDLEPYSGRMLLVPSGQVFFANGSETIAVYDADGGPDPAWRPRITALPTTLIAGNTYPLRGEQLNGLSQAVSYGDDATMATNYPIVRLQYPTNVRRYCRTANHSSMGVRTGTTSQTTEVTIPPDVPAGAAMLVLIANGIHSQPYPVTIEREDRPRTTR